METGQQLKHSLLEPPPKRGWMDWIKQSRLWKYFFPVETIDI